MKRSQRFQPSSWWRVGIMTERWFYLFIFCMIFFSPSGNDGALKSPKWMKYLFCRIITLPPPPTPQGSSTKDYFLQRTMQSLERYFYLIVFNAYLHQQVNAALRFSASSRLFKISAANRLSEVSGEPSLWRLWFYAVSPPLPPAPPIPPYPPRSICWPSPPASASGCAATPGSTGYWPAWTCRSCRRRPSWSPKEPASWWGTSSVDMVANPRLEQCVSKSKAAFERVNT